MPNRDEMKQPAAKPDLSLKLRIARAALVAFVLKGTAVLAIATATTLMGAAAGAVVGFVLPLGLPMWKLGAVVAFVSNIWKESQ